MVLVSAIIFGLLIRNRLKELEKLPKIKTNLLFIIFAFILIPIFFLTGNLLLKFNSFAENVPLSIFTHFILILIPSLLLIGVFGRRFIKEFIKRFYKLLLLCLGISIIYDILIFQVWKLWPIFSDGVLKSVTFLTSLTTSNVQLIEPRILIVNKFAVSIEQACSGLDSLFLFMSLYFLISSSGF